MSGKPRCVLSVRTADLADDSTRCSVRKGAHPPAVTGPLSTFDEALLCGQCVARLGGLQAFDFACVIFGLLRSSPPLQLWRIRQVGDNGTRMNDTADELRREAARCRLLAAGMTRLGARALLLDMAHDFQQRADRLEQLLMAAERPDTHVSVATREHAAD